MTDEETAETRQTVETVATVATVETETIVETAEIIENDRWMIEDPAATVLCLLHS